MNKKKSYFKFQHLTQPYKANKENVEKGEQILRVDGSPQLDKTFKRFLNLI